MKRIAIVLLATLGFIGSSEAQAQEFQVVVNADCELGEISSDDLSKIFQKKARKLPTGDAARPVDQESGASVREAFSQAVHGRSSRQIESYWQQQVFSGRDVPPEQKESDADVIEWVRSNPGAIGYVSADANVTGVKVLRVIE